MSNINRVNGVISVAERSISAPMPAQAATLGDYAEDVFSPEVMRDYLSKEVCAKLLATINNGEPLDASVADDVAQALKRWAMERGATHYTHWFQPLTGSTAEKHDSFLEPQGTKALSVFSGKNLIMGEPDASSFPSGGLRSTFEARGYTAWDPTSPAFIKRHGNGATLCIPTAFCSYTGEALDRKTPLLRSLQAISKATRNLMKHFGLPEQKVSVTLGPEQEYFLIDKHFYLQRPDLLQTGRTLFGAPPAKHQQLEDHYFGTIKKRILNFMTEVEQELWKLGIPAKTRHNEVAPAQFELAPMFEELNLASDHNMLVMEVLRQVAERHGLVCLLHEKPFAGVNGSGKHNNWSVSYGGQNLLNPGVSPHENAIFLTVLCSIIEAIDLHSDLLRATVAGTGNDHRLGANEAPPAIISMYLGEQLADVIHQLESGSASSSKKAGTMRIGVDTLPPLPRDATDRNRTSPFAFTGNKFEFRAPGSSQSCAAPNTILNTIVAEAFDRMAERLSQAEAEGKSMHDALQEILPGIIRDHKRVLFNGDGYKDEWLAEAAKRGLPNARTTPEALQAFINPKNAALMEKYGIFTARELKSRYEVYLEDYQARVRIEGEVALEMASSMIWPAVAGEYSRALRAVQTAEATGVQPGTKALRQEAEVLGNCLDALSTGIQSLREALADGAAEKVLDSMATLRTVVDDAEKRVGDECWPLPKYREMLFVY